LRPVVVEGARGPDLVGPAFGVVEGAHERGPVAKTVGGEFRGVLQRRHSGSDDRVVFQVSAAIFRKSSHNRTPGIRVGMVPNGPRYSSGAFGFGSKVSR